MRRLIEVLGGGIVLFLLSFSSVHADYLHNASQPPPAEQDSLARSKAIEPSLQQVLDGLGYNINVQTDLLPMEVWVAIAGQHYGEVMLTELAGYAPSTNSGWYGHGAPADTHVIFRGPNTPPDSAFFYVTGCDSNGLFIDPGQGPQNVFYTEQRLNSDHFDHAKVYWSKKRPNEFIIGWEDYYGGGDQDFQDLVLLYRMPNRAPTISVPHDTTYNLCSPQTICFRPITAFDPDYYDTAHVTMASGPGTFAGDSCRFTPAAVDSIYRFIFVATDWFGATARDTVSITVHIAKPVLSCAGDELTCDSTLASATVTSNPSVGVSYLWKPTPVSGQGTAAARYDTPGTKWVVVTVTATGCKDSCSAVITQDIRPPSITCPDSMVVHSGHQSSGNFTVNQSQGDSIVQVVVWVVPAGTGITNLTVFGGTGRTPTTGHVEYDASCAYLGIYNIWLKAIDRCGLKDSCSFQVRIYDQPPQLICPANDTIQAGDTLKSTNFSVTDPDGDPTTVTLLSISPAATNTPIIVNNHVEWISTAADYGDYAITVRVTDECGLYVDCTFHVFVRSLSRPPIAVRIGTVECGEVQTDTVIHMTSHHPAPGDFVCLPIEIKGNGQVAQLGGFELEVDYDYTNMSFGGISKVCGDYLASGFEKLTYRSLPCPSCGCCKYKIEIVGIADMPGGTVGQAFDLPSDWGALVWLQFTINENENLRGLEIPVCWEFDSNQGGLNCGQNTFSSPNGNILYTSKQVCQYDSAACEDPGVHRAIAFQPIPGIAGDSVDCSHICGGINICNVGQYVCKRGDVNDNGVPYDIADAVLFSKYFVDGLGVFSTTDTIYEYQVCATDVNADGRTLTLSDLVYLIRVILKDAPAIPMKLAPSSEVANVIVYNGTITTVCASPIGAILFEFDSAVNPTLLATNMEMESNGNKVLVWSRNLNSIQSATQVLSVGDAKLVSVTAVDRDSRELVTSVTAKVAPTTFALNPAYP
ncbi:MAG: DUF4114 domain-containing protein, partial [Candidatus Zixiibacteriota bacterium]